MVGRRLIAALSLACLAPLGAAAGQIRPAPLAEGFTPAVRVWVDGSDFVRRGDRLRVRFETDAPAYVFVARVDAEGMVSVVHPRSPREDGFVAANVSHRIDARTPMQAGTFRVHEYGGNGYVFAIASSAPFDLEEVARGSRWRTLWAMPLTRYGSAEETVDDVARMLFPDEQTGYTHDIAYYTVGRSLYSSFASRSCFSGYWSYSSRCDDWYEYDRYCSALAYHSYYGGWIPAYYGGLGYGFQPCAFYRYRPLYVQPRPTGPIAGPNPKGPRTPRTPGDTAAWHPDTVSIIGPNTPGEEPVGGDGPGDAAQSGRSRLRDAIRAGNGPQLTEPSGRRRNGPLEWMRDDDGRSSGAGGSDGGRARTPVLEPRESRDRARRDEMIREPRETRSRGEGRSGGRAEPRSEPRSEPRHEPRSQPRSEPRNEPRSQPRSEPRNQPRSEPRQPRSEPRSEPRRESPPPRSEPRSEPRAQPRSEPVRRDPPPQRPERRPDERKPAR